MQSLEILKQELITQKELLDSKGFPVNVKSVNPSPSEITEAIENINLDFSQSTSEESDVLLGKTFYSKDTTLKTGTLVIPDVESATATEDTVLKGKTFYAGNTELKTGTLTVPDLSETTATRNDVVNGKVFYDASGEKVVGTYEDMLQQRINLSASNLLYKVPILNADFMSNLVLPSDINNIFAYSKLTQGPRLDTSKCTNLGSMFSYCEQLKTVPDYDTSNATSIAGMYSNCSVLETAPNMNTGKVENMSGVFRYCRKIKTIPAYDVSNVTTMSYMFGDSGVQTIPELNSIRCTNFVEMFRYCGSLTTVSGLDMRGNSTSIANMRNIFVGCSKLENLNLKNVRLSITIGSGTSYGHLLTLESLLNTFKELWTYTGTTTSMATLTIGSANLEKIANVYIKLIDITDEMRAEDEYIDNKAPFVQCESTDEGAMLVTEYVTTIKNWQLA